MFGGFRPTGALALGDNADVESEVKLNLGLFYAALVAIRPLLPIRRYGE